MNNFFLTISVILLIALFVFYIILKINIKKKEQLENENKDLQTGLASVKTELDLLKKEVEIEKNHKKKAQERIKELSNGDIVDNAINGLSKHSSDNSGESHRS